MMSRQVGDHIRQFQIEDELAVVRLSQQCRLLRSWNNPHRDIARKLLVRPDLFLVVCPTDESWRP
jgi:hypothetical protein